MIRIYGKNCIREAVRSNQKMDMVYVLDQNLKKDSNFVEFIKDKGYKVMVKNKVEMDKLFPALHQGYGAFRSDYKYTDLFDLLKSLDKTKRNILLVLDSINDPHNFGAMLRSCDAFDIQGVIIPKNRSVQVTEAVWHVSTGAIEYVPIVEVNNLATALRDLKDNGYWIVGTDAEAKSTANDIDKSLNIAVIIGSEGFGISKVCKKECDYYVKIPMYGHVNSLNASVSCGIILSELK
jgi:23S rRNA (guanosine2251-2'-O)-methyltransferase